MLTLEGRLIRLRDIRLADMPRWERFGEPGNAWLKFDAPWEEKPTAEAIAATRAKLTDVIERQAFQEPRSQLVIADRETDAYIGHVSRYFKSKPTEWAAVGIGIHDDAFWGQGRGTEAMGLWCDYLFASFPTWRRLTIETWSGNIGMMRVAEKLGFALEARYREARPWDGGIYDAVAYGILRVEWAARYPTGFAATLEAP